MTRAEIARERARVRAAILWAARKLRITIAPFPVEMSDATKKRHGDSTVLAWDESPRGADDPNLMVVEFDPAECQDTPARDLRKYAFHEALHHLYRQGEEVATYAITRAMVGAVGE